MLLQNIRENYRSSQKSQKLNCHVPFFNGQRGDITFGHTKKPPINKATNVWRQPLGLTTVQIAIDKRARV